MLGVGVGLTLGSRRFNPASLALTGWWRASYAASPWVGTASAGASGSRNLTEATNPPAAGTAVNGLTPADFDGTNDKLGTALTLGDLSDATAGSIAALFYADAATADAGAAAPYVLPAFLGDELPYFTFSFGSAGIRAGYNAGSGWDSVASTASTGAWHLGQCRWNGSVIEVRVDGGAWVTSSPFSGGIFLMTGAVIVGRNYDSTAFFNGRIADLMTADSVLSTGQFDGIRSYVNSRYGISV